MKHDTKGESVNIKLRQNCNSASCTYPNLDEVPNIVTDILSDGSLVISPFSDSSLSLQELGEKQKVALYTTEREKRFQQLHSVILHMVDLYLG